MSLLSDVAGLGTKALGVVTGSPYLIMGAAAALVVGVGMAFAAVHHDEALVAQARKAEDLAQVASDRAQRAEQARDDMVAENQRLAAAEDQHAHDLDAANQKLNDLQKALQNAPVSNSCTDSPVFRALRNSVQQQSPKH